MPSDGELPEEALAAGWQPFATCAGKPLLRQLVLQLEDITRVQTLLSSCAAQLEGNGTEVQPEPEALTVGVPADTLTFRVCIRDFGKSAANTTAHKLTQSGSLCQLELALERASGWSRARKGGHFVLHVDLAPVKGCTSLAFRLFVKLNRFLSTAIRREQLLARPEPCIFVQKREETMLGYDVSRYPFAQLLHDVFQLYADVDDRDAQSFAACPVDERTMLPQDALAGLHTKLPIGLPLHHKLARAFTACGISVPGDQRRYDGALRAMLDASAPWKDFLKTYRQFVKEVVAPLCGTDQLIYQCPPTLRISMPGSPATIQVHCDAEYPRHQRGEVNFWLPVTQVYGSNTLWLETTPGESDFRPIEMEFGKLLRFNGYECRHYTCRNDTATTRVSFDLRALPVELARGEVADFGDYPAERLD